jgi:phenylpyruvate tautomerase PptA (4-oxalocrotonate tautomerase family)
MPFINTKTNVAISKEQEVSIKEKFGQVISDIGKSEGWLMVGFDGETPLYFKGSDEPCAISEVSLYGKASANAYNQLTADITQILNETLHIDSSRIYVKYQEVDYWGFNGSNF